MLNCSLKLLFLAKITAMKRFENLDILTISSYLQDCLQKSNIATIVVPNPDSNIDAISLKAWVNLAELLKCKLLIPKIQNSDIVLTFKKLDISNSFHSQKVKNIKEKYGTNSLFFTIDKLKEPTFSLIYKQALQSVDIANKKHILNLGINRGDEFEFIKKIVPKEQFENINFYGVDHSKSAIEYAKKRLNGENFYFFEHDINNIKSLNLPKMDLIISIGTLQSPTINYKPFLMELVQKHLSTNGALILGFPNSRWIDGELIYGAKVKNYSFSELSLLFNDVIFAKKYLQQKRFKVTITGKEYIFVTAFKK
jgi:2-polyprenyl-3-methyl-5-hydroxy-6-metoxy-1,4-benzoquinol methylase